MLYYVKVANSRDRELLIAENHDQAIETAKLKWGKDLVTIAVAVKSDSGPFGYKYIWPNNISQLK